MTTERIQIVVSQTGARRVRRDLEDIGKGASGADGALTLLKRTIGALGFAALARELVKTADGFTNITNKLKLVTTGTVQLSVVQGELLRVANATRSGFEDTVDTYAKIARQSKALGASQREVIQFTESLNQAIILSGADAQQTAGAIRQLGQAMGSGALRGDELNTVMENTPEVAIAIANGMGITIAQLRALGAQGKITSQDILRSFREARVELDERFGRTVATVGQSTQVFSNNWTVFIGELNASLGITAAMAQGILYLSKNLDTAARIAAVLAITVGVTFARQAIPAAISGVQKLTLALVESGWGAVLVLITAAAAALVVFSNRIRLSTDGLVTLADVGVAVWNKLKDGFLFVARIARSAFSDVNQSSAETYDNMSHYQQDWLEEAARSIDEYLQAWVGVANVIGGIFQALWSQLVADFKGVVRIISSGFSADSIRDFGNGPGVVGLQDVIDKAFADAVGSVNFAKGIVSDARDVSNARRLKESEAQRGRDLALESLNVVPTAGAKTAASKTKKGPTFSGLLRDLETEGKLLGLNNRARERAVTLLGMESSLKRKLTPDEGTAALAQVALNQRLKAMADLQQPTADYIAQVETLNDVMAKAPTLTQLATQALAEAEIQFLSSQQGGGFADGYARQLRIMQLETRNAVSEMGAEFASLFGPGGTLSKGIGDAVAQSIVFGERFDQSIKKVAQSIVGQLISSLVQLGVNMTLNAAIGNSTAAAATAVSVGQAGVVSAAWATPAALVNAATFGAAGVAGTASLTSSIAAAKALSVIPGFAAGGYTGDGPTNRIAGAVHGGEYVLDAATTARVGRRNLDRLAASRGEGGGGSRMPNITVINADVPGMAFETNQLSAGDVEIIARRQVTLHAAAVVAKDTRSANGKMASAITTRTSARMRR
jgi:tape measure domain-containing protein